jgi:hypothetical protein
MESRQPRQWIVHPPPAGRVPSDSGFGRCGPRWLKNPLPPVSTTTTTSMQPLSARNAPPRVRRRHVETVSRSSAHAGRRQRRRTHRSLEDLILRVLPHASLDHDPHDDGLSAHRHLSEQLSFRSKGARGVPRDVERSFRAVNRRPNRDNARGPLHPRRRHTLRLYAVAMLDDGAPVHLGNGWYRYEDDAAAHYYYNTISEVTQWDAPTAEQCAEPEWDHDDGGAAGEGAGQGTVGETDTLTAYFTQEPAEADDAGVPTSRREPVRAGAALDSRTYTFHAGARGVWFVFTMTCTGRVRGGRQQRARVSESSRREMLRLSRD